MRKLLALIALLSALGVHAEPASQASVENLLAVTKAESMMNSLYSGMEQTMRAAIKQALKGKLPSTEQQRSLDALVGKFVAIVHEEISWEKLKPQYVQIYRETFEQEEIDGLLAFYSSPAGQALIQKMPVVMQKSMAMSQSMMQSMLPRMVAAIDEAMSDAKASAEE